jgi:uncharacterized membrane protein
MTNRLVSGVLVAALLSGCVATGGPERPDSAASDDQTATRVQGSLLGALVGGLIGAAAGDGKGALIGAAVGAGVGYLAGNEVAKRKAQYAREEDFLDAEIAQAEALNREAVAYNDRLRGQIASLDAESKALTARYRTGQASRDQLAAQRNSVQERLTKSRQVEENLRKEHDVKAAVAKEERGQRGGDDPYVKSLEKQVKELQANIDNLHRGSAQLARIDERLSV